MILLKRSLLWVFLILGSLLAFVPGVTATHSPPPYFSATVGSGGSVNFTFSISQEDTAGAPTFSYHLWRGIFIPSDEGDVSGMSGYTVSGSNINFTYTDPFPQFDFFYISANDGTDTVYSCAVEINTGNDGESSSCSNQIGLSVFMEDENNPPQADRMEFRFTRDASLVGYNYSLFGETLGVTFDFGAVEGQADYLQGDNVSSFDLLFGGSEEFNFEFWLVISNGTVSFESCRVAIDTSQNRAFDACGPMVSEWQEYYCLPSVPTEQISGFNYRENVDVLTNPAAYSFFREPDAQEQSLAAINLPGDTRAYELSFAIEADSEGEDSNFNIFLSTVNSDASSATAPDKDDRRPTDGAFSDGYGVNIREDTILLQDGWHIVIYRNQGGVQEILYSPGHLLFNPNTWNHGNFSVDPWQGVIRFELTDGTTTLSEVVMDLDDFTPEPGSARSLWFRENGGHSSLGFWFPAETFMGYGACLLTQVASQYGSIGEAATGGELSDLPDFVDQGGYVVDPSFPGLNLNNTSAVLGIDLSTLGFIMAAVLVIVCVVGFGPIVGGGLGAVIAAGTATALGLIPAWLLVLVFFAMTAGIVLTLRTGSEA